MINLRYVALRAHPQRRNAAGALAADPGIVQVGRRDVDLRPPDRVQAEIAEAFGVSQPTISRAVAILTALVGHVLADHVPVADDLDPRTQYIVDGTLLPCWSWRDHRELYSGKHKTTGMNVQVACDLNGRLAWISDPVDGCRHDSAALALSGVVETLDAGNWMGDKGYIGNGMITPIRKPADRDLLDWEKEFNTNINKIRYLIERTIANLKVTIQLGLV